MTKPVFDDLDLTKALLLHNDKQDVRRAHYGPLKRWFAALAQREQESANIVLHGNSIISGGFATTKDKTWTRIYTDAIQRMYRLGGVGYIPCGAYLAEWIHVGGSQLTTVGPGRMARAMTGQAQTSTITFTGDRFWLMFWGDTTVGNAEIIIDGAAAVTFNTNTTPTKGLKYDSGTLAATTSGTHTVTVRGAVGATIALGGIFVFNTDFGKGVKVWELGHSGQQASGFTATTWDHWTYLGPDMISPDLVVLEFGLNEQAAGTSAATFKTNMGTLITNYNQTADFYGLQRPSIVLLGIWAQGFAGRVESAWLPYRTALRELALERGCAFFDLYDLAGWVGAAGSMSVADLVINGTINISSPTAEFRAMDVGTSITGPGIPNGTTIASAPTPTTATMSAAATASGTIIAKFPSRQDPQLLTADMLHPNNRGHQWIADEFIRLTAGLPKLSNIPQGILRAKGDFIVGAAADVAARLAAGADGQVPHSASSNSLGVVFADPGVMSRILQYVSNPGLATFSTTGFGSVALVTSPTAAANADQADGPYVRIGTATTLNSDASVTATTSPYAIVRPAWIPEFVAIIGTDTLITTSRIWAGLFSATPVAASDPAVVGIGFRYDTAVDGTAFWRCWSNDGTTTGLVTITTAAIAISSRYRLRIESWGTLGVNPTEWRFYINDALVAIHRTELPGGSTNNLGPHVSIRALAALAARNLLVSRVSVSYK